MIQQLAESCFINGVQFLAVHKPVEAAGKVAYGLAKLFAGVPEIQTVCVLERE